MDRHQMGTFPTVVWWESWHFWGLPKQINTRYARRKSMGKACSNWRCECLSMGSWDATGSPGWEQVRWLTSGMTALIFGHFVGWPAEHQKRNAAAVDQDLSTYYCWLSHWWWEWGQWGSHKLLGNWFSNTCPLTMTKQRETLYLTIPGL